MQLYILDAMASFEDICGSVQELDYHLYEQMACYAYHANPS